MYIHVDERSMAGRWWWFGLALSVWMTVLLQGTAAEGTNESCTYVYTKQPPSASEVLCNPYEPPRLQLQCEVCGPSTPSFSIAWFRNSEKLTQGDGINITTNTTNLTEESTAVLSTITIEGDSVQSAMYYCRVIDGSTSEIGRSHVLGLATVEDLMNQSGRCTDPLYTETDDCADITVMASNSTATSYRTTVTPTPSHTVTSTSHPGPTTSTTTVIPSSPALPTDQMPDPNADNASGSSLQVWLYVVVAVAAVFAMIIIVLTIMCMGLCLRKSQTGDLEAMKQQEQRVSGQHFLSTGSSVLWNGTDQRHLDLQGNPTSSTQLTNNSHSVTLPVFSDYNTLGERDYEVIDIPDHSKNEYHRLQRPSLPNGRPPHVGSLPVGKSFSKMQSIASTNSTPQMGGILTREGMVLGRDTSTSKSDRRVCKSLDVAEESADFPYSPPSASSPDILRQFSRNDSSTHLLPHGTSRPMDTLRSNANESLYSPANPLFQHALQGVPETGTMFPEPPEPSEFPVHVYECIPGAQASYETPVPSKKSSAASIAAPVGTLQSRASEADYPDSTADYTGTGEAVVNLPVTTLSSDYYPKSSTGDFTGDSQYSDTLGFMTDFTGASAGIFYPTSKSLPDFADVTEFTVEARSSTLGRTLPSEEPDRTDSSDFTGPIPLYHVLEQNNSHLQHSHYRPHPYKRLDPSTMAPVRRYAKLQLGKNTAV